MSNITLAWPNHIDKCELSSPQEFVDSLPLINLKTPIYQQVARASGVELTLIATCGEYLSFSSFSIANHNLTASALVRVRVYYDEERSNLLYDSGDMPAWPALHQSTDLEWEEDAFWLGTARDEDRELFTPLFTHFSKRAYAGRAVVIDIVDSGNLDGYIELGRVLLGRWWEASLNPQYGDVSMSYEEQTERTTTNDGTDYFYRKRKRRLASVGFTNISEQDAVSTIFGMHRTQGIDGEVIFAYDREPNAHFVQRTFAGRLQQLDPLSQQDFGLYSSQINLREVI